MLALPRLLTVDLVGVTYCSVCVQGPRSCSRLVVVLVENLLSLRLKLVRIARLALINYYSCYC